MGKTNDYETELPPPVEPVVASDATEHRTAPAVLLNRIPDSYDTRMFAETRVDNELGTFDGHASTWWAVDSYLTAFAPGSAKKSIKDKGLRIPVLYFHDPTRMVGPTLEVREDDTGVYHKSRAIDDGETGSYVLAHLRGGSPMAQSFGFRTLKDRAATDKDPLNLKTAPFEGATHEDVRVITEYEVFEFSLLPWVFASNPTTDIKNVRAKAQMPFLSDLIESIKAGTLTDERTALIEHLIESWNNRDGAGPDEQPPTHLTVPDDEQLRWQIAMRLSQSRISVGV